MNRKYQWLSWGALLLCAVILYVIFDYRHAIVMLNPKGWVALQQRDLMLIATVLMLLVVIPVFVLTYYVSVKFHASNKKAEYTPDWDNSVVLEMVWWGVPFLIVLIISAITYTTSQDLDPFKPLDSKVKPLRVQAVALQWKWLFIYPEQKIATVNYLQIPEKTPINFEISGDAPMNSLWIPQLAGQIYAMSGMVTKLHIIADHIGEYRGASGNLSGEGYSSMFFTTKATTKEEFDQWVSETQKGKQTLGIEEYKEIRLPSEYVPPASYTLKEDALFDWVVMNPLTSIPNQKISAESKP